MNNKQTTSIFIAMIATVSLIMITPGNAEAVSYHSGKIWTSDSSHSGELHNNKIPFAFDTSRLSANIELTSGTTIDDFYSAIEGAIDLWNDNTDVSMERYDTIKDDYDNKITSNSLTLGTHARTANIHHWVWSNLAHDTHIIKSTVYLNDHSNHGTWGHDDFDRQDKKRNTQNVLAHELGHSIGLCDTYQSSKYTSYACTGVKSHTSIMSNQVTHVDNRSLTSTDISTVNGAY